MHIPRLDGKLFFLALIIPALLLLISAPSMAGSQRGIPVSGTCSWEETHFQKITLEDPQKKALLEYALSRLTSTGRVPAVQLPAINDGSKHIVFVSVSDGIRTAEVFCGEGAGIHEALDSAIENLEKNIAGVLPPLWVKIDIVKEAVVYDSEPPASTPPALRGLLGMAFTSFENCCFIPEMVIANDFIDSSGHIQAELILAACENKAEEKGKTPFSGGSPGLVVFRTESFFTDGTIFESLYRGSPLFFDPGKEEILKAAGLAAHYLARATDSSGRFDYLYDPVNDISVGGYNMLRHAGTLYSMLEYFGMTGDPEILRSAERALSYLVSNIKPIVKDGTGMACLVEGNEVKLGGNGLGALAICKYIEVTGDRSHLPLLLKLGEWMLSVQDETGNFTIHKQLFPNGAVSGFRSGYYPGEAIFGLMRIYSLDPQPKWFSAASRAARYLINVRDKGLQDHQLPHDHWLLYGLAELFQKEGEPLFLEHSLRIANAIIGRQNRYPLFPDWNGGFSHEPLSAPAATRMEGLSAACNIALSAGKNTEAREILSALNLGAGFLLRTQIGPSLAMYMKNPPKALGAIRESLTDHQTRIDHTQHSLSALIAIASFIVRKN